MCDACNALDDDDDIHMVVNSLGSSERVWCGACLDQLRVGSFLSSGHKYPQGITVFGQYRSARVLNSAA